MILVNGVIENAIEFLLEDLVFEFKKFPVDYYFSNLVQDPRQRGHWKCIVNWIYNYLCTNITKVPVEYYFIDLVRDPRQRGHWKCIANCFYNV